jgi:tRNA pseudouridine55 synthase
MIQQILAQALTTRLKDPRIGFVTVTGVTVTRDLSVATVRVSIMGDEQERAEALAGLEHASGYLRSLVARIDKPAGPTSHDIVAALRRVLGVRRVGHTGTLDPFASGLLVILIGRATRLAQFLVGLTKRYRGVLRLGTTTDSGDPTGTVTGTSDAWQDLTADDVQQAMTGFLGPQRQRPPALSAKKVGGQRAYRIARRGENADIPLQDVEIFSLTLTDMHGANVVFDTLVSSGTYVRSLARDLGDALGCGAHLSELRRTAVGPFTIDHALAVDAASTEQVRPPREAVAHLQAVTVGTDERESVRHGRAIVTPAGVSGPVALVDGEELVAVAEADGNRLQPRVVLAE